ncbi:hypothetical protein GobsT_41740 [Gemmata obscuriglobus]|uniref:Uncharacterized protein n=1 Tax=Gemmata obscuriglobus TaxID=114 RepID=A0A2Z3H0G9_9BACT|nr:hypothetical protein [Gemmata obscuriglobus]AWM37802.1 hypothetical protein C1280_12870 [Gemmata obscuriglobus]QEG29378.1 hypothetical protein GobsT_41740 [Gemmata obscuriglobus]VTS08429.1 unnamed protein product [Gemmata obscuriglobus UQM 2246]
MLMRLCGVALVLFVSAIVAALFGFGVIRDEPSPAAQVCAAFLLFTSVAAFGWAWVNRSQNVVGRVPRRSGGSNRPLA